MKIIMKAAIQNDTKLEEINEIIPHVFSQLTVWDKTNILKNRTVIYDAMQKFGKEWIMNLICLKEGKSYILSNNKEIKKKMENLMGNIFDNDIMTLPEMWLRKEIIKKSFLILNQ